MRLVDWLARTAMLVLAALATLAMIGSLASVSNSAIGDAFPGEVAWDQSAPDPPARASSDTRIIEAEEGTMAIESPSVAPSAEEHEVARWLKALTYAVLALAVFAAAGVIALVRIAAQLHRIAER